MAWAGGLDEDAIDGLVGIQVVDEFLQFSLADVDWRQNNAAFHADFRSGFLLLLHVGNRGGVVSDPDQREARFATADSSDFGLEFGDDGGGDIVAFNQFHLSRRGTGSWRMGESGGGG